MKRDLEHTVAPGVYFRARMVPGPELKMSVTMRFTWWGVWLMTWRALLKSKWPWWMYPHMFVRVIGHTNKFMRQQRDANASSGS